MKITLDLQMVKLQLDRYDMLGKIPADIGCSNMQANNTRASIVCFDDHMLLSFPVRRCECGRHLRSHVCDCRPMPLAEQVQVVLFRFDEQRRSSSPSIWRTKLPHGLDSRFWLTNLVMLVAVVWLPRRAARFDPAQRAPSGSGFAACYKRQPAGCLSGFAGCRASYGR